VLAVLLTAVAVACGSSLLCVCYSSSSRQKRQKRKRYIYSPGRVNKGSLFPVLLLAFHLVLRASAVSSAVIPLCFNDQGARLHSPGAEDRVEMPTRSKGDRYQQGGDPQPSEPGLEPAAGAGSSQSRGAYDLGKTAWQCLSRESYEFLKKSHAWRLDKWSRTNNISWACTLLLRHANSFDRQKVILKKDGFMRVQDIVSFKMLRCLDCDPAGLDRMIKETNYGAKKRFLERRENGYLVELAAAQGHSGRAHDQLDDDLLLVRCEKSQVPRICLHGTMKEYTNGIYDTGLKPGGNRGMSHRAHIHFVEHVAGQGETSGVRGGSNAIIQVDMHRLIDDGAEVFRSQNNVYLTSGLWNGQRNIGVPREYFVGIIDVYSGEAIFALPVGRVDRHGRPEGAEEIVAQAIVSREEAERIKSQVGFTLQDEAADLAALEKKKEARRMRFTENALVIPQSSEPGPGPAADAEADVVEVESDDNKDLKFPPLKTSLVNSKDPSGRFRRNPVRPLQDYENRGLPEEMELYVRQLGGPPKYSLPWYTAPPYEGRVVFKGSVAGDLHGPIQQVIHVPRLPAVTGGKARPGFVVCGFRNPYVPDGVQYDEHAGPAIVYVNVWCTDNNRGEEVGVNYCELEWYEAPESPADPAAVAEAENALASQLVEDRFSPEVDALAAKLADALRINLTEPSPIPSPPQAAASSSSDQRPVPEMPDNPSVTAMIASRKLGGLAYRDLSPPIGVARRQLKERQQSIVRQMKEKESGYDPMACTLRTEAAFDAEKSQQSSDPGLEPDADAADKPEDPADYGDDEADEIVVTPLLDASAVVDLMANGIPTEDIGWRAEKIRAGVDLVFPEVKHDDIADDDLVLLTTRAQVACASGESDTESIRDFDSGTSKFRYHRRMPYWYRRDPCLNCEDGSRMYRRRMKPVITDASSPFPMIGWDPEALSDDDGEVNQESFALSAQVATDEVGRQVGAHPDVQPTIKSQSAAEDRWHAMFGTRFTDANTSSVRALKDKYRVVARSKEIMNVEVDFDILFKILDEVRTKIEATNISVALDEAYMLLRRGMDQNTVGLVRVPDKCGQCQLDLLTEEKNAKVRICPFCNCWLHEADCYLKHTADHTQGILCRGFRRREAQRCLADVATKIKEEKEKETGQTEADVFGIVEPPPPAPPQDDPMSDFHKDRPSVDLKLLKKEEKFGKQGRRHLRSDTSDEEQLEPAEYCTVCGSDDCWREPALCRSQNKKELQDLLVDGFLSRIPPEVGKPLSVDLFMKQTYPEVAEVLARQD